MGAKLPYPSFRAFDHSVRLKHTHRASHSRTSTSRDRQKLDQAGLAAGDAAFLLREARGFNGSSTVEVDAFAEQHSISKADAKAIVDSVFAAVTEAAARDEEVTINGFGKFKVKEAAAREGRNPATGETIQIAASKRMGFTPAKALKDRLKG